MFTTRLQHHLLMQYSLILCFRPLTLQIPYMYTTSLHEPTWLEFCILLSSNHLIHLHDVGVLHVLEIHFTEFTLNHPPPEVVDVVLLKGNGFDEEIVARTDHIEHQYLMVSWDSKDSLVVADRCTRREVDDDPLKTFSWYHTPILTQWEDVPRIRKELITSG